MQIYNTRLLIKKGHFEAITGLVRSQGCEGLVLIMGKLVVVEIIGVGARLDDGRNARF